MPGSTPIYGFPYPDPSDLVANYPALGQQLAEDVETAIAASGKVLQIKRATDSTARATSSTSYVDASISVTITPQKTTTAIIVQAIGWLSHNAASSGSRARLQITTSGNTPLQGAQDLYFGSFNSELDLQIGFVLSGQISPASLSAQTYKVRFAVIGTGTATISDINTTQLYAYEVEI